MITQEINCTDSCGKSLPSMEVALQVGWTMLQITGRFRCPECVRALDRVNAMAAEPEVALSVRPSEWKTLSPEAQAKLNGIMSPEAVAKVRADRLARARASETLARKPLL